MSEYDDEMERLEARKDFEKRERERKQKEIEAEEYREQCAIEAERQAIEHEQALYNEWAEKVRRGFCHYSYEDWKRIFHVT